MKNPFAILLLSILLTTGTAAMAQSLPTLPPVLSSRIQGNYFIYEGYRFDIAQVLNDEHLAEILGQLEHQVDYIDALHLSQDIQDFFKSLPCSVAPQYPDNPSTSNFITFLSGDLLLHIQNPFVLDTLLSFLLENLPQGANNPSVVKYFKQAKTLPCYQEKRPTWISDFYSSGDIYYFFAKSASSYLRGSVAMGYSCYEIKKNQPEFFHFLENLFGPNSGFLNQCFSYHGFNFNYSQMNDFLHFDDVRKGCIQQVNYIESAGIPAHIIDFFKTVPLSLKDGFKMPYDLGEYTPLDRSISLNASSAALGFRNANQSDFPLLHELLHAFQDQVLLNGDNNPYITQFFREAQQQHYYDHANDTSFYLPYSMTNEHEFFACTATAFLANHAIDEPSNRENICKYQPDYYLYLQGIFGSTHNDMHIIDRSLISDALDHLY